MHRLHIGLMLICCMIPLILIGGLFLVDLTLATGLLIVVALVCVGLHAAMFYALLGRHDYEQGNLTRTP